VTEGLPDLRFVVDAWCVVDVAPGVGPGTRAAPAVTGPHWQLIGSGRHKTSVDGDPGRQREQ
jgi:hypothetical protein